MSKYKVGFLVNSNANAFCKNVEVVDLVDDYNYSEEEAEEIIKDEDKMIELLLETDYFDNNDIEDNFYYRQAFVNQVEKSITGVSKELYLTVADVKENLPAGFMGTIISWKNMIKGLSKFKKIIKTLDLEKEIKKMVDTSKRFFGFIDEEIKIDNIY